MSEARPSFVASIGGHRLECNRARWNSSVRPLVDGDATGVSVQGIMRMMTPRGRCRAAQFSLAVPALLSVLLLTACKSTPYGDVRLSERRANIDWVCASAAEREAQGEARLNAGADWIESELRRDVETCRGNAHAIEKRSRFESDRWEARQPLYRETAGRLWRAKPERIERTAVSMFY